MARSIIILELDPCTTLSTRSVSGSILGDGGGRANGRYQDGGGVESGIEFRWL
jgi:hypothetical protein